MKYARCNNCKQFIKFKVKGQDSIRCYCPYCEKFDVFTFSARKEKDILGIIKYERIVKHRVYDLKQAILLRS